MRRRFAKNIGVSRSHLMALAIFVSTAVIAQTDSSPQQPSFPQPSPDDPQVDDPIADIKYPVFKIEDAYLATDFTISPNHNGKYRDTLKTGSNSAIKFSAALNKYIKAYLTIDLEQVFRSYGAPEDFQTELAHFIEEAYVEIKLGPDHKPVVLIIGKQNLKFGGNFTKMPANYNSPFFEALRQRKVFGLSLEVTDLMGLDIAQFSLFESKANDLEVGTIDSAIIRVGKFVGDGKDSFLNAGVMYKGNTDTDLKPELRATVGVLYQDAGGVIAWAEALYLKNHPRYDKEFALTTGASYNIGHGEVVGEMTWLIASFEQLAVGYRLHLTKNVAAGAEVRYTFSQESDVIPSGFTFGVNLEVDLGPNAGYSNPVFAGAETSNAFTAQKLSLAAKPVMFETTGAASSPAAATAAAATEPSAPAAEEPTPQPPNISDLTSRAPFTALRLGSVYRHKSFAYPSHQGSVTSNLGNPDATPEQTLLENFIKAQYMREDVRLFAALESLAQVERSAELPDALKTQAMPLLNAWRKSACQAYRSIEKNGVTALPSTNVCFSVEVVEPTESSQRTRTLFALNPLAQPAISVDAAQVNELRALLSQPEFRPLVDVWSSAYQATSQALYWQFFDKGLRSWTWAMVLQEEALNKRIPAPQYKDVIAKYNKAMADTGASAGTSTQSLVSLRPEFLVRANHLLAPFELDSQAFQTEFQNFKQTEYSEKLREEFTQAVAIELIKKAQGPLTADGRDLRALDQKVSALIAGQSFAEVTKAIQADATTDALIVPGQVTYRKMSVAVDTTQAKPLLLQQLRTKLDANWIKTVQDDLNLAIKTRHLSKELIDKKISETYLSSMQNGYSPKIQNQVLLYQLALEVKANPVTLENMVDAWTNGVQAEFAKLTLTSISPLEDEIQSALANLARTGHPAFRIQALRNFLEFRLADTFEQTLLSEQTRFVGRWKAEQLNATSKLIRTFEQSQGLTQTLQAASAIKFKIETGENQTTSLFDNDPLIEGLLNKVFDNSNWKTANNLSGLVEIHYDTNVRSSVSVFIVDQVTATTVLSAFEKQDVVGPMIEARKYADAFKTLRTKLLSNYQIEMTSSSGDVMATGDSKLSTFLGN